MVAIYYSISDRCYSQRDFYETFRKAVNAQSNIVIVSCILFCIATWIGYSDHACTVANNSTKKQLNIMLCPYVVFGTPFSLLCYRLRIIVDCSYSCMFMFPHSRKYLEIKFQQIWTMLEQSHLFQIINFNFIEMLMLRNEEGCATLFLHFCYCSSGTYYLPSSYFRNHFRGVSQIYTVV